MGRISIAPDNKTNEGAAGFPSIKLTEKGQKTRFTVTELPWREYVHYIKCPQFEDNGKAKKETRTRKDKSTYEDYDLELVGSEICLGDESILKDKGTDEKNCPACEASVKSGGDIDGPKQRFAVNVIEYTLSGSGDQVRSGKAFAATIKVWKFTGRIYDEIEGIQEEIGDLRKHDLVLECEEPRWQRNKLSFRMEPGYSKAPEGYIKELLTTPGNKATDKDLKDACGREVGRAKMQDDVDYAMRQWRRLNNESGDVPEEFKSKAADLGEGLDDLLGTSDPEVGAFTEELPDDAKASASEEADPFSEFLPDGDADPTTTEPAASAGDPAGTASAPTSSGEEFDFDGLLEGI